MNDNEEELLRAIPLRAPSSALDDRMEKLLAAERIQPGRLLTRAVPAWQLAAACAACAAGAFLAGALVYGGKAAPPARDEVRYVVQVEQKAFDVFDWTKYPKKSAPLSVLKAQRAAKEAGGKI
jgi:hypothetical protein